VLNAGKQSNGAKRGKTRKRVQARENMQKVQSTGRHENDAKRGKRYNRYQARQSMQTAPSLDWV